jgi:NAD(P)-dependent dehydrogenase (short-subunit alcohol dehydrogenase family)
MDDPFNLGAREALVWGASGGIGAATTRLLAARGARVAGVDLRAPEFAWLAAAHAADIAERGEVERVVAAHPGASICVVAAAICPWDDWRDDGWDAVAERVAAVNLGGAVHVARAFLDPTRSLRDGRLVLVTSLAGRMGGIGAGAHYAASKGGLHALAKWLARRAAPSGTTVNAVAPANVDTPMMAGRSIDVAAVPLGRAATPEYVAGPIAFLCSPAAAYVTGTVLDVNGGAWMAP